MKRIKFFGLVLLLVCVLLFSGCTRAGNAKIETCRTLYEKVTKNYYADERTEKIRVFDAEEDGRINLYSSKSYSNITLINQIAAVEEEGSRYFSNILRKNGEYDVIIKAVSEFYLSYYQANHTLKDADVPQELKTKLYEYIDELGDILKKVKFSKQSLQDTIDTYPVAAGNDIINELPVQRSYKTFLTNYKLLIEKFYQISSTYEEILTNYIYVVNTKTQVPAGGRGRLIRESEVYIARYYYLKHFVLVGYDDRFSFEKVYDESTSQFVNNPTYDDSFKVFITIVNSSADDEWGVPDENDYTDEVEYQEALDYYTDKIFYYGCCLTKFESLKTNLNNYEQAAKYIAGLNGKTTGNKIAEKYLEFMADFDQQVFDYQQYLNTHIIWQLSDRKYLSLFFVFLIK